MGEVNNNWWLRIEGADGVVGRSTKEQITIDFLNANRTTLPPDRFQKLVDQTIELIKRTDIQEQQIRTECEKELEKLKKSRSVWEITKAMTSKVTTSVDQLLSGDKITVFENGEHINKSVHEFEKELSTKDIMKISSLGIANYLEHLHSKHQLTPKILIEKFGGENLQKLGVLWKNGGSKNDGKNSLLAYQYLMDNDMGHIIDIVTKLSSSNDMFDNIQSLKTPKEQEMAILLLQEKSGTLKERFKRELIKDLIARNPDIKEANANDIINKLLQEALNHKGVKGLPLMYKAFDTYNKKYRTSLNIQKTTTQIQNIQKVDTQVEVAKTIAARSQEKDPKKQTELDKKMKTMSYEKHEQSIAEKANRKMKQSDITDLISGKKQIEQVVEEIRKTDKEFDQEYKTWEKEKISEEKTAREKTDKKQVSSSKTPDSSERGEEARKKENVSMGRISEEALNALPIGSKKMIRLSRDPDVTPVEIEKIGSSRYRVKIGGNETSMFSEEIPGHIKSCRLLQKTGLESMMHIKPSKLTEIMQVCSKQGDKVDNSNGDFGAREQALFLESIASTLGIRIKKGVGISTLKTDFKNSLSLTGNGNPQTGFKKLAQEKGFMNEAGIIDPDTLKTTILNKTDS